MVGVVLLPCVSTVFPQRLLCLLLLGLSDSSASLACRVTPVLRLGKWQTCWSSVVCFLVLFSVFRSSAEIFFPFKLLNLGSDTGQKGALSWLSAIDIPLWKVFSQSEHSL